MRKSEIIRRAAIFDGFSDNGVQFFAAGFAERQFGPGDVIMREGESGTSLFIVAEGELSVELIDRTGMPKLLRHLGPGDYFGEVSLLKGGPHLVSVTAVTDAMLLELPQAVFLRLQKEKPQTCLKLVVSIVQHFAGKMRQSQALFKDVV